MKSTSARLNVPGDAHSRLVYMPAIHCRRAASVGEHGGQLVGPRALQLAVVAGGAVAERAQRAVVEARSRVLVDAPGGTVLKKHNRSTKSAEPVDEVDADHAADVARRPRAPVVAEDVVHQRMDVARYTARS